MVKKMNEVVIYTYTADRLEEFKKEKPNNVEIVLPVALTDKDNPKQFVDENEYYFDVTNLYKSHNDTNSMAIEDFLYRASLKKNFHIMINSNFCNRFKEDYASSFNKFLPINNIYKDPEEFMGSFADITQKEIIKIKSVLNESLIGHEDFKVDFVNQIQNFPILNRINEIKIFSVLLCGNSGIGKTELARILHKSLYENSKMIKINLGNYKSQGAINSLIGSPKGYYGSERGGELSNKIKNSNSRVIIIDEFEKADTDIFNFFYELLEDGIFTDLAENEFDLNGYLIIFTTNLDKNNYKNVIPTSLLSRFTMKCVFEPLNMSHKKAFINKRVTDIVDNYNKISDIKITEKQILEKLDFNRIDKTANFRAINRIIRNLLIKAIEESKNKPN